MTKRQTDLAVALAETWINGNRADVYRALRSEQKLVACSLAIQIYEIVGSSFGVALARTVEHYPVREFDKFG